jgi:hypothetical protein
MIETAYTVWQASTVTVTGVPDNNSTHTFKVELYGNPGMTDLQAYVDDPAVRNVAADFIVRTPLVCLVSMSANVYYPKNAPVVMGTLQSNLAQYINSRSFVQRLTRSELTGVLIAAGASRVELGTHGMLLTGTIRGANGTWYTLSGDQLNVADISLPAALLTPDTVVFAAETQNLHLTGIPE